MDTEDYHESVTVTRHGRVIIISIHGIMHLLLGNQHARLNLRMRDMWLRCQQEGCVEIKLIFPQLKMRKKTA